MRRNTQPDLFGNAPPLPEGFRYEPDVLTPEEERELVGHLAALPFEGFEFHGFVGKRRVVSFGLRYDFNEGGLREAEEHLPPFLLPLRARAAGFANLAPADFRHALVTEYAPGAPIGWHRDKPEFDRVVGVSLLSPCDFRFRRRQGTRWQRATVMLEPRSAYLLAGAARTEWEHSIPAMDRLRYSITFRNLRRPA